MTADEILGTARSLMERPGSRMAGVWPRASALLARQALEAALDEVWTSEPGTGGLADCPMRTQLLCAPSYLDPVLATKVAWAWTALSRACHHHAYELAPTAGELDRWMTVVAELIETMARQPASR